MVVRIKGLVFFEREPKPAAGHADWVCLLCGAFVGYSVEHVPHVEKYHPRRYRAALAAVKGASK